MYLQFRRQRFPRRVFNLRAKRQRPHSAKSHTYAISIVSGGAEVLAMRTDPGMTVTATMKKQ